MKRTLSIATFRKLARAEETVIRACMPRTAATDQAPLEPFAGLPATPARRTWRLPLVATPLRTPLAEVAGHV